MTHLEILRLLVKQHDAKQFQKSADQYAWFLACRAVEEADVDAPKTEENAA